MHDKISAIGINQVVDLELNFCECLKFLIVKIWGEINASRKNKRERF